jgi:hypothetical protein
VDIGQHNCQSPCRRSRSLADLQCGTCPDKCPMQLQTRAYLDGFFLCSCILSYIKKSLSLSLSLCYVREDKTDTGHINVKVMNSRERRFDFLLDALCHTDETSQTSVCSVRRVTRASNTHLPACAERHHSCRFIQFTQPVRPPGPQHVTTTQDRLRVSAAVGCTGTWR